MKLIEFEPYFIEKKIVEPKRSQFGKKKKPKIHHSLYKQ